MEFPTYEILSTEGDIHRVHFVAVNGYDEIQYYKAAAEDMDDVLAVATVHFSSEHEAVSPRLNTLHVNEIIENINEVDPVTVQDGVVVPLP